MKTILTILMSAATLLLISSCATVPKAPLGPGELRLLSMDIPQNGTLSANIAFFITINFEADDKPELTRVCFNFPHSFPYCLHVEAKYVTYGPQANFQVPLRVPTGSDMLECYAEYIRNGQRQRTNTVSSFVIGYEETSE